MDYVKKYEKIVRVLIKKHFPSLRGIKIKIKEKKLMNAYTYMLGSLFLDYYSIFVSPELRNKHQIITAGLVHELIHFEDFKKWKLNFFQGILLEIKYLFSKKYRTEIERRTDIKTIKKGYGKGLLLYRKFLEKSLSEKLFKKRKAYYLSKEEIAEYLKRQK